MSKRNQLSAAFFIMFVLLSLVSYLLLRHTQLGCEMVKGRWATHGGFCVSYDCYHKNACGLLAFPARECAKTTALQLGDSIAEVYFYLGEPSLIEDAVYTWQDKSGGEFSATIAVPVSSFTADMTLTKTPRVSQGKGLLALECLTGAID